MFVAYYMIQGDICGIYVTNTKAEAESELAESIMDIVDDHLCSDGFYKTIERHFTKEIIDEFLYITNKQDRNKDKLYRPTWSKSVKGKVYRVKDKYALNLKNLEKLYLDLEMSDWDLNTYITEFNKYTLIPASHND